MKIHEIYNKWMVSDTSENLSSLVICTTFLFIVYLVKVYMENKNLPPGPWGIPLLGHMTLLGKNPLTTFDDYRRQYGDIYRLRFGSWPVVVISGKDAIKTALQYNGDTLSDRPELLSVRKISGMKGIAFCHNDQSHVLLRKNAISALKMFSRNSNVGFQEILANESDTLIMEMLSQRGEPFNPNECLYFSAANVIFQIAFGKDCDLRQNSDISWAVRNTMTLNNFAAPFNPLNMFPWLRFVLPRKMNTYALYQEYANRSANALIQKQTGMIETHDEHEMRHLVDALVAISKGNTWHGKKVTKEMIFSVVADLIGAGFDTTASSLKWGILFLASHHEVQERVQKEIDEIVGQHRKPSVLDRKNLQYSEAVVLEILRMAPILPLALPHSACTKTKLLGFTIPENTIVLVNLLSSNLDRQLWRSPTEFKPERFLDQDGNIDNKIADNVMSFGTGRRRCIGEQLARSNIFVFLTSLLQRCKIIQPEDEEYDFEGKLTLTYVPNTFKIKVRERS